MGVPGHTASASSRITYSGTVTVNAPNPKIRQQLLFTLRRVTMLRNPLSIIWPGLHIQSRLDSLLMLLFLTTAACSQSRASSALSDTPCYISDEWIKADQRLAVPVDYSGRTTVGEFCEWLTAAKGIRISASDRDGAADPAVFVNCSKLPIWKVLNAVWATMSYRGAQWIWERHPSGGQFTYRLTSAAYGRCVRQESQGLGSKSSSKETQPGCYRLPMALRTNKRTRLSTRLTLMTRSECMARLPIGCGPTFERSMKRYRAAQRRDSIWRWL